MKQRIAAAITGIVVATMMAGSAIAEEHGQGMQHGKMMQDDKEMSEKQGMMKHMPMMQGGMMGGMMQRQVIATQDGGIVVIIGNMLLKYDKKLELVKKTEIEISDKDMQQMMMKMKKCCPMCQKMMKDKESNKDD